MTPEQNADRKAYIIVNDLDSMAHRIEDLPAHPHYTDALLCVQQAKTAISKGMQDLHQKAMQARFGQRDAD